MVAEPTGGDGEPAGGPLLESYSQSSSGLRRFDVTAMGTVNALLLSQGDLDETELALVAHDACEHLLELDALLSKFRPDSELSLVNGLAASRPVAIGEEFLELLLLARQAWEISDGAFDPTVGPLLRAWGLVDLAAREPADAEIAALLECRGMDLVEIDPGAMTVRFARPGVEIDLGGIAKGWAIDRLAARLCERGVTAGAILGGRSTVLSWGDPPDESGWAVEVVHPDDPDEQQDVLCRLDVQPGALSTSGAYERCVRLAGRTIGHIVDPRSGRPVDAADDAVRSATVWTRCAAAGDVLSTALFVSGTDALGSEGCVERLVKVWDPPPLEPRASVLLALADTSSWGGIRTVSHHSGEPGFRER